MGFICVVPGCRNSSLYKSIHIFPSNPEVFRQWTTSIGRTDLLLSKRNSFRICEDHFPDSMKVSHKHGKFLKKGAYPVLNLPGKRLSIKLEDIFAGNNIIVETETETDPETIEIESDDEVVDCSSSESYPECSNEFVSEVEYDDPELVDSDEEIESVDDNLEDVELSDHSFEYKSEKNKSSVKSVIRLVIVNKNQSMNANLEEVEVNASKRKSVEKEDKVIEIESECEEDHVKGEINEKIVELSDEEAEISSGESEIISPVKEAAKKSNKDVKEVVASPVSQSKVTAAVTNPAKQLNENVTSISSPAPQLEKELQVSDLISVCRVCLKSGKTVSLFTSYCDELNVADMISTFTKEKIVQKDDRPQNICFNCINLAYQTHFFYTMWMNSQETINRLLNIQPEPTKSVDQMIQTDFAPEINQTQPENNEVFEESAMVEDATTSELPEPDVVSYYDSENNAIITYDNELSDENFANAADSEIIKITWRCNLCQFDAQNDYKSLENHYYRQHAVKIQNNSTIVTCCLCEHEFANLDALATHIVSDEHLALCKECPVCNLRLPNTVLLQTHMVEHRRNISNDSGYPCAICEMKFDSFEDILSHFDMLHSDKGICVICCRNIRLDVRFHMNSHRPNGLKYSCKSCLAYFADAEALDEHKLTREHKKRELLICPICDRQFKRNIRLVKHLKQHKEGYQAPSYDEDVKQDVKPVKEEKLICSVCNKVFWKEKAFVLHCAKHENKNAIICPVISCNLIFDSPDVLMEHIKSQHQQYSCKKCDQTFFSYDSVSHHLSKHDWENAPDPPNANTCKICNKAFSSEYNCHRHVEEDHRLFPCECNEVFTDKRDLLKHSQEKHGENVAKNNAFQCHICEKQLQSRGTLKTHLDRHLNLVKKFECQQCKKLLSSRASLEVHMRLHRGEKPYICKYCGVRFTALYTKMNHERRHTGDKPHACPVCGKRFIQPTDMKKHQMLHYQRKDQRTRKRKRLENTFYESDIVNVDDISIANNVEFY